MGKTVDIRPTEKESAVIFAPFDEALDELQKNGYKLISLEQNAELRIQEGISHNVSKKGNWVKEGVLYIPEKGRFITRHSPIVEDAKVATQAHSEARNYFLTNKQIERALEDSVKIPKNVANSFILTNRFGSNKITKYAFGGEKKAKAYGEFLDDAGIKKMLIYLDSIFDRPFVNQIWFGDLFDASVLHGSKRGIHYGNLVRGILPHETNSPEN
jgi:hypothetical protein